MKGARNNEDENNEQAVKLPSTPGFLKLQETLTENSKNLKLVRKVVSLEEVAVGGLAGI